MRLKKEDSKARERELEEQLAAESSANQELQVRFNSKFSLHSITRKIKEETSKFQIQHPEPLGHTVSIVTGLSSVV